MPSPTRLQCPDLRDLSSPPVVGDLCPGYRLARWDSPADLAPECRDRLHHLLRDLAARAFAADHSGYWRGRVSAGFFDQISTLALVLGPDGEPVGWGGYHRRRFAGRRALYLDAAGVVPAHRRFGLSAALMAHFLTREVLAHPFSSTYVVLRTRHPAVYSAWRDGLGPHRVHPHRDRPLPVRVRRLAGDAAAWLGDGPRLEPDTLLVRGAYRMFDGDIYGVRPHSGDERLDAYFAREVGPKDALLVVARVGAPSLVRILAGRAMARRSAGRPPSGGRPSHVRPEEQVHRSVPNGAGASGLIPGARP
ncbi:GNAT family N-acetyltransferase [Nocardiopsis sp. Huas11]|uniref:GNAT family N-acetyltransferase n=1 Tax=Nocardiopsis sp. Huas11 TaxID=2183912 RepID=UPI000EAFB2B0|nr:GNAT family N-acetyltransferase [Nocardiopsis sp. Huas11]